MAYKNKGKQNGLFISTPPIIKNTATVTLTSSIFLNMINMKNDMKISASDRGSDLSDNTHFPQWNKGIATAQTTTMLRQDKYFGGPKNLNSDALLKLG